MKLLGQPYTQVAHEALKTSEIKRLEVIQRTLGCK